MNHSSSTLTEALLSDWLEEYANLEPPHLRSFATEQEHNDEVVIAIFNVLEERLIYNKLVEPVCDQLFAFYRSREPELQKFALQFVPSLIRVYLGCTANGDKQSCRAPEALLISMYNLEVTDTAGKPRDFSFRMPSIALTSIYHEPMSLAPSFLTEGALRRLEECNSKRVSWGPFPQVEALNAQNRLKVMTALMFVYNHHLNQMSRLALENVCKVIAKIVTQGFSKPGHHQRPSYGGSGTDITTGCSVLRSVTISRIPLSSQFLLELLHASHHTLHRGVGLDNLAARAIDDIYQRARHEAYADVQLLATAIRRSINTAHLHGSRPSVISVATAVAAQVSKSMITNASFRTKKLPEDLDDEFIASITESRESASCGQNQEILSIHITRKSFSPKHIHKCQGNAEEGTYFSEKEKTQNKENSPKHSQKGLFLLKNVEKITETFGSPTKRSAKDKKNISLNDSDRMSAGAKLFSVLEESVFETDEILETLMVGGRPASITIVSSSTEL